MPRHYSRILRISTVDSPLRRTSALGVPRRPVASGISKWVSGYTSQEVCPWNVSFAKELREPAFRARDIIAERDARTLAREILAMGMRSSARRSRDRR
jgi:hypothetical protein